LERAHLEAAAESVRLQRRVIFTGQVSDVRPFYANGRVFALPSRNEGSPNVLLEAMAANRPVVATAVGGVPRWLPTRERVAGPSNDPKQLASAIANLLTTRPCPTASETSGDAVDTQHSRKIMFELLRSYLTDQGQAPQQLA